MAIPMSGSPGDLYNRLGKIGLLVKQMKSYQTTQLTNMTDTTNGVVAQFNAESDIQADMGSNYITLLNSPAAALGSFCQQMSAEALNRMVFRDQPRLNQNLQQTNLLASLVEVIRQMEEQGATVLAMTVTGTPGSFVGHGNGIVNVSVRRAADGKVQENSFAEDLQFTCDADSFSGTATEGNESFTVSGSGSQGEVFAFDWPLGSNATVGVSAIDGNSDNSAGNLLTNSGYEAWTNNVPDNWELTVGVGGTNVFRNSSIVYDGDFAMQIVGDGSSTLTALLQEFDNGTDGTDGALAPQSQYSVNTFARRDGIAAAAGVWEIALVNESGVIVQDDNGTNNSFTIDLTTLTTSYASFTGVFRTPSIMPSQIFLRQRLTTALTNGRSVYFDKMSLGEMTLMYTGGPSVAVHAGSVPFLIGDYEFTVITNSRGAAGTLSTFQTLFNQFFDMLSLDLLLPSSSTPTISDALIG